MVNNRCKIDLIDYKIQIDGRCHYNIDIHIEL